MLEPDRDDSQGHDAGMVFDIKRYSVHDGPGIRTTVFLKGCPLRCLWCHNPESQDPGQEIIYHENLCIQCGECLKACPREAQTRDSEHKIRREICDRCGRCVETCYPGALKLVGGRMTVQAVLKELEKDEQFYKRSGGGITLSGGEPASQPKFSLAILKGCVERGYHTTIETCGHTSWITLREMLRYTDLVIYDIKQMDPEKHLEQTGVPNRLILDNLMRIDELGKPCVVRVPITPGHNDSDEDTHALAKFLNSTKNTRKVEILPYHQFGVSKYKSLGRKYSLRGLKPPSSQDLAKIGQMLREHGLDVIVESVKSNQNAEQLWNRK